MRPKYREIIIPGERERGSSKLAMYFVLTPEGRFLLKGQNSSKIQEYIKKNFPICIYRYTFWGKGTSRGGWQGKHPSVYIHFKERTEEIPHRLWPGSTTSKKTNKIVITFSKKGSQYQNISEPREITFTCRRMPNKWIPEWDDAIKLALKN